MPWPSTRTTTGWREALIAAFSAAGVRPVGFGTVWTRGVLARRARRRSRPCGPWRDRGRSPPPSRRRTPAPGCAGPSSAQMPLLVEDRHDHGDGGEPHVGLVAFIGRLTLPRTGDTGARRPCARPGPQIVWAYGAHGSQPDRSRRPPLPRRPASRRCPPAPPPRSAVRPSSPAAPRRRRRPAAGRPPARPYGARARAGACGSATTLSVVVLAASRHRARGGDQPGRGHRPGRPLQGHEEPARRPGNGMNVLLVGTDGRDRISEAEQRKYRLGGAPCHCTDTIMLGAHLGGPGAGQRRQPAARLVRRDAPRTPTGPPGSRHARPPRQAERGVRRGRPEPDRADRREHDRA